MAVNLESARMVFSAVDRASGIMRRIANNHKWFSKETSANMKKVGVTSAKVGAGVMSAGATVAGALLHSRGDTEDALGGLATMGVKNLQKLEDAATKMSNKFSRVNRVEILDAAYAIKSGIGELSDEGVARTSRMAAMLGVATKASTNQMTDLYAQAYSIYGEQFDNADQFGERFGAGVAETVKRFRTDGMQMQAAIANTQNVATNMGVGMAEQLAVLGMLRNTYQSGSTAGTAYAAIMERLIGAGNKLGTSFVDQNGKALPMVKILGKLAYAKEKAMATGRGAEFQQDLQEAFGETAIRGIGALMDKYKQLGAHIKGIDAASMQGEKHVSAMAAKMEKGSNRAAALFINQLSNLANIVGSALSPGFQAVLKPVGRLLVRFQGWAKRHPKVIKLIGMMVIVLGTAATALGVATVAMWAFNAAMALNPLVWIVAAVAGLVAVAVGIYSFWDDIVSYFGGVWDSIGSAFKSGVNFAIDCLGPLGWVIKWFMGSGDSLQSKWDAVMQSLADGWQIVKDAFLSLVDWLVPDFLVDAGSAIMSGFWDGLKSVWDGLTKWISSKVEWISDIYNGIVSYFSSDDDEEKEGASNKTATPKALTGPKPEDVLRSSHETKFRAESQTRIELDLKNAQGVSVNKVDKSGSDDISMAMIGLNFGPV